MLATDPSESAALVAADVRSREVDGAVSAATNKDAAAVAQVVVLAVPYDGHDELVAGIDVRGDEIRARVVVSAVPWFAMRTLFAGRIPAALEEMVGKQQGIAA